MRAVLDASIIVAAVRTKNPRSASRVVIAAAAAGAYQPVITDDIEAEYREVLILKHIEELDYQEIAAITGAGIPALKVRAHRGRELLRRILERAGVTHG